jgi:hypothetical protein
MMNFLFSFQMTEQRFLCRCPRGSFDFNTYTFSIEHSNTCPYFFNPSLSDENWQLLRDQGSRFSRNFQTDDDEVGEYVPQPISRDYNFQRMLNTFRSSQLIDSVFQIGSGQNLLKFNFFTEL